MNVSKTLLTMMQQSMHDILHALSWISRALCSAIIRGMNNHLLQEDALGWRAKATEAIGIIAAAIGVEPFRPHIQGIMQAAFQVCCCASLNGTACLERDQSIYF